MAYTVKKLAVLSGVSVRTLHFYDEIGLLPPAYVAKNGYRYYEEEQLLVLQQILFFRELGFELKQIQNVLSKPDFDRAHALVQHKQALIARAKRCQELINTIEQTIKTLQGERHMDAKDMYRGFSPEKQAEHEEYLVNRYGDKVKRHIEEANTNTKKWSQQDWDKSFLAWDAILKELKILMDAQESPSCDHVQKIIKRHYEAIKNFWVPDKNSYIGLTESYIGFEWREAFQKYDDHHPNLAKFLADAALVFAKKNLK